MYHCSFWYFAVLLSTRKPRTPVHYSFFLLLKSLFLAHRQLHHVWGRLQTDPDIEAFHLATTLSYGLLTCIVCCLSLLSQYAVSVCCLILLPHTGVYGGEVGAASGNRYWWKTDESRDCCNGAKSGRFDLICNMALQLASAQCLLQP